MSVHKSIPYIIPDVYLEVFKEMFRRVGAEFDASLLSQEGWFRKYSWTQAQEDDFRKWLKDYFKKHRKSIFGFNIPVKLIDREIPAFLLNYSWSTKEDDNE